MAYRLLGSVTEAEDAVQEAYLRLHGAGQADLADRRAWLTTVVSRLCLDLLRSARARRETYVGTWLPEPLTAARDIGDTALRPARDRGRAYSRGLSTARLAGPAPHPGAGRTSGQQVHSG